MGGDCVLSKKRIELPETHTATEFLRGQASRIFDDVAKNNKIVVVVKHSKPQNVIMSYEEYKKLTKEEASLILFLFLLPIFSSSKLF